MAENLIANLFNQLFGRGGSGGGGRPGLPDVGQEPGLPPVAPAEEPVNPVGPRENSVSTLPMIQQALEQALQENVLFPMRINPQRLGEVYSGALTQAQEQMPTPQQPPDAAAAIRGGPLGVLQANLDVAEQAPQDLMEMATPHLIGLMEGGSEYWEGVPPDIQEVIIRAVSDAVAPAVAGSQAFVGNTDDSTIVAALKAFPEMAAEVGRQTDNPSLRSFSEVEGFNPQAALALDMMFGLAGIDSAATMPARLMSRKAPSAIGRTRYIVDNVKWQREVGQVRREAKAVMEGQPIFSALTPEQQNEVLEIFLKGNPPGEFSRFINGNKLAFEGYELFHELSNNVPSLPPPPRAGDPRFNLGVDDPEALGLFSLPKGPQRYMDEASQMPDRLLHGTRTTFDRPDPEHFQPGLHGRGHYMTTGTVAENFREEAAHVKSFLIPDAAGDNADPALRAAFEEIAAATSVDQLSPEAQEVFTRYGGDLERAGLENTTAGYAGDKLFDVEISNTPFRRDVEELARQLGEDPAQLLSDHTDWIVDKGVTLGRTGNEFLDFIAETRGSDAAYQLATNPRNEPLFGRVTSYNPQTRSQFGLFRNLYRMEEEFTVDDRALILDAIRDVDPVVAQQVGIAIASNPQGSTKETMYQSIADAMGGSDDLANQLLQAAGFDGIHYPGGQRTGNHPHDAFVAFDSDQVFDGPDGLERLYAQMEADGFQLTPEEIAERDELLEARRRTAQGLRPLNDADREFNELADEGAVAARGGAEDDLAAGLGNFVDMGASTDTLSKYLELAGNDLEGLEHLANRDMAGFDLWARERGIPLELARPLGDDFLREVGDTTAPNAGGLHPEAFESIDEATMLDEARLGNLPTREQLGAMPIDERQELFIGLEEDELARYLEDTGFDIEKHTDELANLGFHEGNMIADPAIKEAWTRLDPPDRDYLGQIIHSMTGADESLSDTLSVMLDNPEWGAHILTRGGMDPGDANKVIRQLRGR